MQVLAKLKDFTEMMTGDDQKVEATAVGGMSPDVPHARSDGLMGPKQLSRFEKKEGLMNSVVVLTVNATMHVVGVSACNLSEDLSRRYLDARLGVFLPTLLAELNGQGYVVGSTTQFQNMMVYTLSRSSAGGFSTPPQTLEPQPIPINRAASRTFLAKQASKPTAHREPPTPPPSKSSTVTVV